jgi:uncharacterized membrane protein
LRILLIGASGVIGSAVAARLGFPAFTAVMAIFWPMIARPEIVL